MMPRYFLAATVRRSSIGLRVVLASVIALAVAIHADRAVHAACETGWDYVLDPPATIHADHGIAASIPATIHITRVSAPLVPSCEIVAKSKMKGVTLVGLGGDSGSIVPLSSIDYPERTISFTVRIAADAPADLGYIEIQVQRSDVEAFGEGRPIGDVPVSIENTLTVAYKDLSSEPGSDDIVPPAKYKVPPIIMTIAAPDPYIVDPIEVPCPAPNAATKSNLRCGAFAFWTIGSVVGAEGDSTIGLTVDKDTVITAWYYGCGRQSCPGSGGPPYMLVKAINLSTGTQMSGATGATMTVAQTGPGIVPFPTVKIATSRTLCMHDTIPEPCASGAANVTGDLKPDLFVRGLRFDRWRIGGADVAGPSTPLAPQFAIAFYKLFPTAPAELTCETVFKPAGHFIVLRWKDTTSDETEFHVERRPVGGGAFAEFGPPAPADKTTYQDGPIPDGTCYEYRVVAHRHADDARSAYSNVTRCCAGGGDSCPPVVCPGLDTRVPASVVASALADPSTIDGYCELSNPSLPYHPLFNPRRMSLTTARPGTFHPLFNGLVFKAGCR